MNAGTGTKSATNKIVRLDHVDGLRALAAIYVTLHHALLYVNDHLVNDAMANGLVRNALGIFIFGHYAVDVFIVLSGFCLMLPVLRNHGELKGGTWNFFKKRAWRILPPYYAAIAVSLVLIWLLIGTPAGTVWNSSLPVSPIGLLSHIFLFQDWFPSTAHIVNYPLWSISVEWRIYFLFPALVWCWSRFGALRTVATTVAVSFLLLFPLEYTIFAKDGGGLCLHYYGLFALGMLAAGFGYSKKSRLVRLRPRVPWAALFVLMCGVTIASNKGLFRGWQLPWQGEDLLVGIGALSLLVAITPDGSSDRWQWVRHALNWRPLVFVGTFSYSLYLLHAPLLEVVWVYLIHPLHLTPVIAFLLLASAGLAVIIAVSYVFYLGCERPFIGSPKWRTRAPDAEAGALESAKKILLPEAGGGTKVALSQANEVQ